MITIETPAVALPCGSAFFHRAMPVCDELLKKVWSGTPWMIAVHTGSPGSLQWEEITNWCKKKFGAEAWPIHGKIGNWYCGGATIHGFTWLGFATEEMMKAYEDRFPIAQ